MPDLSGRTLGSYRIVEQIGLGGMATVYKAYQPSMDRYVALKILSTHLTQDPAFVKRFQQEARVIAKLEHPYILPVYDHGEEDGYLYLVMRFIEAGTLKDRLTKGPLSLDEVRRIVTQVGSALEYAHQRGVVHRDFKPSNVLVTPQDDCYLTDFGIAKMMEGTLGLTGSGVIGTPHYMAPEQGQSLKVDHRADIYAMGVVVYEMVTGRVPFDAETPFAVVIKHITEPLPLPRRINPNLPEAVERVILKAMAKAPADRYQSMRDMVTAFDQAVQTAPTEPMAAAPPMAALPTEVSRAESLPTAVVLPPPTVLPRRARMPVPIWILAAGLIVLIGLIAGGIALSWALGQRTPAGGPTQAVVATASPTTPAQSPTNIPILDEPTAVPLPSLKEAAGGIKRVGMVTDISGVGDKGFNQSAYEGMLRAAREMSVENAFLEPRQPDDYIKNIEQFVGQGYDIIVTVGFALGDSTKQAAQAHPGVKFAIVDPSYDPAMPNVMGLTFREDQAGFMAGALAGMMTKSKTVGVVAGMEIPPVKRFRNGYENGVHYVCPDCRVVGRYTSSFTDPAQGEQAAWQQIADKADVIFGAGGLTGQSAILAAAQQGVWVIGVDMDQYLTVFREGQEKGADKILSSAVKRTDVAAYRAVKAAYDGSFKGGTLVLDAAADGVGLAPFHDAEKAIPPEVKGKLDEIFQMLASGKLDTGVDPVTGDLAKVPGNSLKVALLAPLSGIWFSSGEPTRNAVQMATDEWNRSGGLLGRPIELVMEDSQCEPEPAARAASKVIDQDGVRFIIGEVCPRASISVSEIASARGVVQISPMASDPAVTVDANGKVKPYTFRACYVDPFQGVIGANFAWRSLKAKTAFILLDPGNTYTVGLAESFEAAFNKGGGAIVGKGEYAADATDFTAVLSQAADARPEVLYVPDYYNVANLIVAQAKQRGLTIPIIGADGWDSPYLDRKVMDGEYFTTSFSSDDPRPIVQDWVKRYRAAYGGWRPDARATLAYDAANILYTAIKEANSDDPARVKDALAALKDFPGVSGQISFDANHNPIKSAVILQMKDYELRYVETVNP
jgi:branched-chain amino acid transport system substrate-binding protein